MSPDRESFVLRLVRTARRQGRDAFTGVEVDALLSRIDALTAEARERVVAVPVEGPIR